MKKAPKVKAGTGDMGLTPDGSSERIRLTIERHPTSTAKRTSQHQNTLHQSPTTAGSSSCIQINDPQDRLGISYRRFEIYRKRHAIKKQGFRNVILHVCAAERIQHSSVTHSLLFATNPPLISSSYGKIPTIQLKFIFVIIGSSTTKAFTAARMAANPNVPINLSF